MKGGRLTNAPVRKKKPKIHSKWFKKEEFMEISGVNPKTPSKKVK